MSKLTIEDSAFDERPTPSLAGTAETMTAAICSACGHDAISHALHTNERGCLGCRNERLACHLTMGDVYRAALVERTAECERLNALCADYQHQLAELHAHADALYAARPHATPEGE